MKPMKRKQRLFRRKLLERQKITNYKNELDRIKGVLSQTVLNGITHKHLKSREDDLNNMIKHIS